MLRLLRLCSRGKVVKLDKLCNFFCSLAFTSLQFSNSIIHFQKETGTIGEYYGVIPSGDTFMVFSLRHKVYPWIFYVSGVLFIYLFFNCETHLCSRILVGASHQVVQGHILGHGHVAELEGEDLSSGRAVWKRHEDDPVESTWTHQSLTEARKTERGPIYILLNVPEKLWV